MQEKWKMRQNLYPKQPIFRSNLPHLFVTFFFNKFGFTPCKAEQPLQGIELQEKETQKH